MSALSQPLLILSGPIHAYCSLLKATTELEEFAESCKALTTLEPEEPKSRQELKVGSLKH